MSDDEDSSDGKPKGAVGYGRPPVSHQFKPGRSGNPRGRPKVKKTFPTMLSDALNEKVAVRDRCRTRRITKQEAMVLGMVNKAVGGDPKAFATVVGLADKLRIFEQQAPSHDEIIDSALWKLATRYDKMKNEQKDKQTRPNEDSQDGKDPQVSEKK